MRVLPYDICRCAGRPEGLDSHNVCERRETCLRWLNLVHNPEPDCRRFPVDTGICRDSWAGYWPEVPE